MTTDKTQTETASDAPEAPTRKTKFVNVRIVQDLPWKLKQGKNTDKAQHSPLPAPIDDHAAALTRMLQLKAHADKLAEALRECITEQGAMSDRSHYNAKRRLQYITDTARLALADYDRSAQ